ncbi:MAG: hypothetical protein ACK4K9_07785 [Bacteroidia bacterium]
MTLKLSFKCVNKNFMVKIYTKSYILQYLYNELDLEQRIDFENEIKRNVQLFTKVNELKSTISQLDSISLEPDQTTIDLILEYSLKLKKEHLTA